MITGVSFINDCTLAEFLGEAQCYAYRSNLLVQAYQSQMSDLLNDIGKKLNTNLNADTGEITVPITEEIKELTRKFECEYLEFLEKD